MFASLIRLFFLTPYTFILTSSKIGLLLLPLFLLEEIPILLNIESVISNKQPFYNYRKEKEKPDESVGIKIVALIFGLPTFNFFQNNFHSDTLWRFIHLLLIS